MGNVTKEYHRVLNYIKEMIREEKLEIGSRLPSEREIAQTLQISRNSTREALKILESNGIIEIKRGSGNYLVCNISNSISETIEMMLLLQKTSMDEVCSFRRYIDKMACEMIFDHNNSSVAQKLLEKVRQMQKISAKEQVKLDQEFHYSLINETNNQLMIMLMSTLVEKYYNWIESILENVSDEQKADLDQCHEEICVAIQKGNREGCRMAIDRHYDFIEKYCFKNF